MSVGAVEKLIRPYVTALFATAFVVAFLMGRVSVEAFLGPAGVVLGFWFQKREEPKPPTV